MRSHGVDEEGRWWMGADAVIEITRRVSVLRPISRLARVPLAMTLVDGGYRLLARNRHRLSRLFGMDNCRTRNAPGSGP